MGTVLPFPQHRARQSASGVRAAFVADRWCIEHVRAGDITGRRPMPSLSDAQRIATRISRRDRMPLLAPCVPRPARGMRTHSTSDDAA